MRYIVLALFVVISALVVLANQLTPSEKEQACIASGGTVGIGLCCKAVGDFPNLCLVGACGCSLANSHEVKICDCGEGKCFDGSSCVAEVRSFEDCASAGYPVMESYPRQCRTPDGKTFVESEESCVSCTTG